MCGAWRAIVWRHACNETNGRKLIAALLTIHLNGGPFLARGTTFGCHNWLPEWILAAKFGPGDQFWQVFCQNQSRGPLLGVNNFGVTVPSHTVCKVIIACDSRFGQTDS